MTEQYETIILGSDGSSDQDLSSTALQERLGKVLAGAASTEGDRRSVKDILIKEGQPIRAVVPGDFKSLSEDEYPPWNRQELMALFNHLCPEWEEMIKEGAIDRPLPLQAGRYRVNMFSYGGEFSANDDQIGCTGELGMAIRIYRDQIPELNTLGLPTPIANLADSKAGLVIVTGPVGNGKTTTCAAFIDHINRTRAGHIITVEDPIEYLHRPIKCVITQRELGANIQSMARGARDAMREFPEAIFIGEVKEPDAAQAAIYSGNAGQLVLASMHANGAVQSVSKLISFFPGQETVKADDMAACLQGVISQILVPSMEKTHWVPIFETLFVDNEARQLISKRDWMELQRYLDGKNNGEGKDGCVSRNASLVKAVVSGDISKETAMRVSLDRSSLKNLLDSAAIPSRKA